MEIPVRPIHTFPSEPKTLWGKLIRTVIPVKDYYLCGKNHVDSELNTHGNSPDVIDRLWAQSYGGFNTSRDHRLFDCGIHDRLRELNYESPY